MLPRFNYLELDYHIPNKAVSLPSQTQAINIPTAAVGRGCGEKGPVEDRSRGSRPGPDSERFCAFNFEVTPCSVGSYSWFSTLGSCCMGN